MKKNILKKKLIFILTVALTAGMFTACGNASDGGTEKNGTADVAEKMTAAAEKSEEAPAEETAADVKGETADDTAGEYSMEINTVEEAMADTDAKTDGGEMRAALKADMAEMSEETAPGDEPMTVPEVPIDTSEPFVLTAGEWNDNENWGFFTNLVNNGSVTFPAYGIDPVNRIEVTISNDAGAVPNEKAELLSADGDVIWCAKTDKNGKAYLFYGAKDSPAEVRYGSQTSPVKAAAEKDAADGQGREDSDVTKSVEFKTDGEGQKYGDTEVMFILDTTGSMGDEISYLQKDFSSIAEEVGNENISFSVNFYRDKGDDYVTKCSPFTKDVKEVQKQLNAEYASGGGDFPEAVAEVLDETMTGDSWSADTNKIAFLIFDAPPHEDKEDVILNAVKSASEKGIHLVPVVASNSDRDTELFGRALAICTNSSYVFLTDDSGVGGSHLEPIIGDYDVELLHDIIVRNINELS